VPYFARIRRDLARHEGAEHDELVIQMNEVRYCASGWVQRAARKVAATIDEPGHPADSLVIR